MTEREGFGLPWREIVFGRETPEERIQRMRETHKNIGKRVQERSRCFVGGPDLVTFDAMVKKLDTIELRGFAIPIIMWLEVSDRLYGMPGACYAATLVVEASVRERDSGEWIWLKVSECSIGFAAFDADPKILVVAVRSAILTMCQHEVDECLHVEGVRVRDPHKNEAMQVVVLPPTTTPFEIAVTLFEVEGDPKR